MFRAFWVVTIAVLSAGVAFAGESNEDEAAVLAVVQQFFDTLETKDAAAARTIMDPEGSFVSVRWQDGEQVVSRSSFRRFLDTLEERSEALLERMWDPQVLIHGPIAIVWTEYDFHRDGEFSHCGMDAFQLAKLDTGWTITGGTYTVEATGCAESPLGPPRANQN